MPALAYTAALTPMLTLAACSGGSRTTSPSLASGATPAPTTPVWASLTLSETGSSLMAPLFSHWRSAHHSQFPQVTLRTASSSSGTGIMSAATDRTGIGASDAYLSPADVTKYTDLVNTPVLSQAQIAQIRG